MNSQANLDKSLEPASTKNLGNTDFVVSPVAMGTWAIGGLRFGAVDDDESIRTINHALDVGVNFFDTAPIYGFGHSEEILGEALLGKRHQAVIATKCGLRWNRKGKIRHDLSPHSIREEVDASLGRLRTDYIDLLQIHWPDPDTPLEKSMKALEDIRRSGKVRWVGCSNFDVPLLEQGLACGQLATLQPPYHLFRRDIETEILPYCQQHDIGVLVYEPIAKGLLSGKYDTKSTFEKGDIRKRNTFFQPEMMTRCLEVVETLKDSAKALGVTLAQLAIAWVLHHPAVHVAITGAKHPEQIASNAAAADICLSKDMYDRITNLAKDFAPESLTQ